MDTSHIAEHGVAAICRRVHHVEKGDEEGVEVGESSVNNILSFGVFFHGYCGEMFLHNLVTSGETDIYVKLGLRIHTTLI